MNGIFKKAYLVIDDCPTSDLHNKVDYLVSQNIPAILFCCGDRMKKRHDVVIYAIKNGFIVANHSYNHPNFSEISINECFEQIKNTDEIINDLHEKAEVKRRFKLFRFPYCDKGTQETGDWFVRLAPQTKKGRERKEKIQKFLHELGYSYPDVIHQNINYKWYKNLNLHHDVDIIETYDSFDWAPMDKIPAFGYNNLKSVLARTDENFPDSGKGLNFPESDDIISMHDMSGIENYFIPLLKKFRNKGIEFRNLDSIN